jgi:hypothetical protein
MGSEWILGRLAWGVWIGFDCLRTETGGGLLWARWWTFGFLRHGINQLRWQQPSWIQRHVLLLKYTDVSEARAIYVRAMNETTRRYIPKGCHLHSWRLENLKSWALKLVSELRHTSVWVGFIWLMMGTCGGLLWSRWWTSRRHNGDIFFDYLSDY